MRLKKFWNPCAVPTRWLIDRSRPDALLLHCRLIIEVQSFVRLNSLRPVPAKFVVKIHLEQNLISPELHLQGRSVFRDSISFLANYDDSTALLSTRLLKLVYEEAALSYGAYAVWKMSIAIGPA